MVSRRPAGVTELPPAVQIKMVRVPSNTKKKNTTRLDGVSDRRETPVLHQAKLGF